MSTIDEGELDRLEGLVALYKERVDNELLSEAAYVGVYGQNGLRDQIREALFDHRDALLVATRALSSLPERASGEQMREADGWQPIETAPHEEVVLLAWRDWRTTSWQYEAGVASHGWRRDGASTMSQHGQATHWRPLPLPPAEERAARARQENDDAR